MKSKRKLKFLIALVASGFALFGFILPDYISASNTFVNFIGIGMILAYGYFWLKFFGVIK